MNMPLLLMAFSFMGFGIIKRKRNQREWKIFLIGGIVFFVAAVVSFISSR